jgi:hypothetical protein
MRRLSTVVVVVTLTEVPGVQELPSMLISEEASESPELIASFCEAITLFAEVSEQFVDEL